MLVFFTIFIFFLFYLLGMPIAFSLLVTTLTLYFWDVVPLNILGLVQTMGTGVDSFILLAVPLFVLAGKIMNAAGITERIFNFAGALVGHIKGGQAHINIIASLIFAGMSGSAVADTAGLGQVEIKAMTDRGYSGAFSAAITAASSTIGPIFPPSIPMLIYAALAGVSVAQLFLAGVVPGGIMAIFLMVASYFIAVKRNYPREESPSLKKILFTFRLAFFPLLTPLIILSFIAFGLTTPTEAAAIAVIYGLIIAIFYKSITLKDFSKILFEVGVTTAVILFIISAVSSFSWIITYHMLPQRLIAFLFSVIENPSAILALTILLLLLLGCIMNTTPGLILSIPFLLPLIQAIEMDLVHFGVLAILLLCIGLLTPPICLCIFVVSDIAKVSVEEVIRESIPFIIALICVALLIAYIPTLVMFLPRLFF